MYVSPMISFKNELFEDLEAVMSKSLRLISLLASHPQLAGTTEPVPCSLISLSAHVTSIKILPLSSPVNVGEWTVSLLLSIAL
jgi:hypothetical protein